MRIYRVAHTVWEVNTEFLSLQLPLHGVLCSARTAFVETCFAGLPSTVCRYYCRVGVVVRTPCLAVRQEVCTSTVNTSTQMILSHMITRSASVAFGTLSNLVRLNIVTVDAPCEHYPLPFAATRLCAHPFWSGASPEHALGVPEPPLWDSGPRCCRGTYSFRISWERHG